MPSTFKEVVWMYACWSNDEIETQDALDSNTTTIVVINALFEILILSIEFLF